MERALAFRRADRVLFPLAVYEHKAFLIGRTPSGVAGDPGLFVETVGREYREYEVYSPYNRGIGHIQRGGRGPGCRGAFLWK